MNTPFHHRRPARGRTAILAGLAVAMAANLAVAVALALLSPSPATAAPSPSPLPLAIPVDQPEPPPPATDAEPPPPDTAASTATASITANPPALPPLDLADVGGAPSLPAMAIDRIGDLALPALLLPGPAGETFAPAPTALPESDQEARLGIALDLDRYYPRAARTRRIGGRSELELDIAADGSVTAVRILASEPPGVFDDAARRLGLSLRFEPARRHGRPAAGSLHQTVEWKLKKP